MSFSTLTTAPVSVEQAGTKIATRQNLNFVSGATVTDNPSNNSADITITGGGSGSNIDGGSANAVYLVSQILDGGSA